MPNSDCPFLDGTRMTCSQEAVPALSTGSDTCFYSKPVDQRSSSLPLITHVQACEPSYSPCGGQCIPEGDVCEPLCRDDEKVCGTDCIPSDQTCERLCPPDERACGDECLSMSSSCDLGSNTLCATVSPSFMTQRTSGLYVSPRKFCYSLLLGIATPCSILISALLQTFDPICACVFDG